MATPMSCRLISRGVLAREAPRRSAAAVGELPSSLYGTPATILVELTAFVDFILGQSGDRHRWTDSAHSIVRVDVGAADEQLLGLLDANGDNLLHDMALSGFRVEPSSRDRATWMVHLDDELQSLLWLGSPLIRSVS